MRPPSRGEIIHEAAILPMVPHETMAKPPAAIPAPITPPTIECVVDTGALSHVAKVNHSAADRRAAAMA